MKRPLSSVRANAACQLGDQRRVLRLDVNVGDRSIPGHRNRAAVSGPARNGDQQDDGRGDRELDVVEVVARRVPARAGRPADPGDRDTEGGDPAERREQEARGSGTSNIPAGIATNERTSGVANPSGTATFPKRSNQRSARSIRCGVMCDVAAVALEQRMPAADADQPAARGAERVARDADEHDRRGRPRTPGGSGVRRGEPPGERPRGERAPVEHRHLARGRKTAATAISTKTAARPWLPTKEVISAG